MRQLRLPGLSCGAPFVALRHNTLSRFPLFARRRGEIAATSPGCCSTGLTLCSGLLSRTPSVLPSFLRTPRAFALLSDSGRASTPGLFRRFDVVPTQQEVRDPDDSALSKLNHTAFALAVYASCRPLGRRRKTRFRWLAKPFRVGFPMPTEFVRRVSSLCVLSPRTYLGATCSCSCSEHV